MGGKKFRKFNKLPERWNDYTTMGNIVAGTRFLPFKTPLKEEICKSLPKNKWFTPAMLLEKAPKLKLIIDLTQTERYYRSEDFVQNGIRHKKIFCPGGGILPPRRIIQQFYKAIDTFLKSDEAVDADALIGVHCTHGLNRTGYLICKYMVQQGVPGNKAIEAFEHARGHKMERELYVNDILEDYSLSRASLTQNEPVSRSSYSGYYASNSRLHSRSRAGRIDANRPYPVPSSLNRYFGDRRHTHSNFNKYYQHERVHTHTDRYLFYPEFK